MASRDAYRTGDDDEGDEEVDESFYKTQKDAVLFAIDVSASMLQRPPPSTARKADNDSAVSAALRCAYQIMQQRILAQPKDLMGILLFGTAQSKFRPDGDAAAGQSEGTVDDAGGLALSHGPSYPHCYLLMDLGVPAAEDVRALKNLVADDDGTGDAEGILTPADPNADGGGVSMANVLFCANQIFTTNAANFGSRRLFIITDNDDPHAGDAAARAAAAVRAKDLYDLGVAIELFPIQRGGGGGGDGGRGFDRTRFYDDIVYRDPAADAAEAAAAAAASSTAAAVAVAPAARSGDGLTLLASLVAQVSARQTPKRAQFSNLPFEVAPGLVVSIKGYVVLQPQKPARTCYVWLDGERPLLATSETVKYADAADGGGGHEKSESGPVPGDAPRGEIKKAYKFGGEYIYFAPEELAQLRQWPFPAAWQGKGLRIIGFKPRVLLPPWASVKRSTYVYPSEEDYVGSTRVFSALWQTLRRTAKVALAWYVPRTNANPQLVAIVPSGGAGAEKKGEKKEEEEEEGADDAEDGDGSSTLPSPLPAGLWLYPLPFAEDIRKADDERLPAPCPPALRDQMRPVVENLFLPKTAYDPTRYPNPALQWHYRILQTLALEEEVPDAAEDRTLPKFRAIDKRVGGRLAALKDALAREADQLMTRRAIKREADDDDDMDASPRKKPIAKRPKTAGTTTAAATTAADGLPKTPAQLRAMVANGTLGALPVAALKAILADKGQSGAGKKAVLVERLEQWVEDNA